MKHTTLETFTTWLLGILAAALVLVLFSSFDEQQEQADAEAYKQEAIQQAKSDKARTLDEEKARAIESDYLQRTQLVSK